MTTAISVANKFEFLDPASRAAKIVASKVGDNPIYESDLPRVKMPAAGSTQWSYEDATGNRVNCDEITGILVADVGRGILWPTAELSGMKPLLTSHDLKVGYLNGEVDFGDVDPTSLEKYHIEGNKYDYAALSNGPEFGFGTAPNGRGKRVKESRILAILQAGEVLPVLVGLGGGSLSAWNKFTKGLKCLGHEAVVTLRLEAVSNMGGQKFSRVKPSLVGTLSEEEGDVVYGLYAKPLTDMLQRVPGGSATESDEAPF